MSYAEGLHLTGGVRIQEILIGLSEVLNIKPTKFQNHVLAHRLRVFRGS